MFRLSRIFRDYEESGALNAYVSLYGFWDEQMVITKAGDLALAVKVQGVDYECLDSAARDYVTKRLESAFRVFDGKLRLYQVVFKENRPKIPWPEHENPVVNTTLQNRRHHFEGNADSLFEIEIYFVFLYEGFRYRTGLLHALPKLAQSPATALREMAALYSNRGQTTLVREQIEAAAAVLRNRVRLFLQSTSDYLGAELLPAGGVFRLFHRLLNVDREKRDNAALKDTRFLDYQLCDSDLEAHRDHLRLGDQYLRVLTLKQPPSQTFPVILRKLLEVRANFHAVSEWQVESPAKSRKRIQSMRRHFHNSKTSILSQLNTADQKYQPDLLVDDSKEALIAELGQCMTAIEMEGRQFGEFSLSLVPQHPHVLANEWIASSLARAVGLSVPDFDIMDVAADVIERNSGLAFRHGGRLVKPVAGPAFASRVPANDPNAPVYDYLPEAGLESVRNLTEFAGVLAVDKWLCQCDGRQVVFCRPKPHAQMRAFFIDWGFVFNAGDWNFPDSPCRGVYSRNAVYQSVTGWDAFEPWLSHIEQFPEAKLQAIMGAIPPEWATCDELDRLQSAILDRRSKVRDLIESVRLSPRAPFENWHSASPTIVPVRQAPLQLHAA